LKKTLTPAVKESAPAKQQHDEDDDEQSACGHGSLLNWPSGRVAKGQGLRPIHAIATSESPLAPEPQDAALSALHFSPFILFTALSRALILFSKETLIASEHKRPSPVAEM
jgi:hypothetical protein